MPVIKKQADGTKDSISFDSKGKLSDSDITSKPALVKSNDVKDLANNIDNLEGLDYSSDDMKYAIATKTAQDRLGGYEDVDDDTMKSMIDDILVNELGAEEGTGRKIRGENWATDAIGTAKNAINGIEGFAGGLINDGFDTVVGGLLGAMNQDWGQGARDLFDADDVTGIVDMAADVGLSAIPGVGIPLVVGKNLIQQSDNIAEGLSGVDNVTQRKLDDGQQLAKLATAGIATGLSAIPGVGKAVNRSALRKVDNEFNKALNNVVERNPINRGAMPESTPKTLTRKGTSTKDPNGGSMNIDGKKFETLNPAKESADVFKNAFEITENPKNIERVLEGKKAKIGGTYGERVKAGMDNAKNLLKRDKEAYAKADKAVQEATDNLNDFIRKGGKKKSQEGADLVSLKSQAEAARKEANYHPLKALRTAKNSLMDTRADALARMKPDKVPEFLQEHPKARFVGRQAGNVASLMAGMPAAATISEMANNGGSLGDAWARMWQRAANDPTKTLLTAFPVGARGMAKRAPGVTGSKNSLVPLQAMRTKESMNAMTDLGRYDVEEGMDEDDIMEALRLINLGGQNG